MLHECSCSVLTDFDDGSKLDVTVCAASEAKAAAAAKGCAQSEAPAPVQACTCQNATVARGRCSVGECRPHPRR